MIFANILKELREEKELSQLKLSIQTGIPKSTLARWELAQSEPKVSEIIILAKFFDVTAGQLLGTEEY